MHAEAQAAARQRLQLQQHQQQRQIQPVEARGELAELAESMRLADGDEVRSRVCADGRQPSSTRPHVDRMVEQSHVLPGCRWGRGICMAVRFPWRLAVCSHVS